MLIVVSHPASRSDEARIINALFSEGLEVFHLRKPGATEAAVLGLLQAIDMKYRSRISLHQYHHLAGETGISRLHYPEAIRKQWSPEDQQRLKEKGISLSTSIHELNEEPGTMYEYVLFGPVFDSISKPDYRTSIDRHVVLPSCETRRIAIGGIDETNCAQALAMGFDGIAVLGAIWNRADAVSTFKKIQSACQPALS